MNFTLAGDSSSSYTDEYVTRCTSNLRMVYGRIKKRGRVTKTLVIYSKRIGTGF